MDLNDDKTENKAMEEEERERCGYFDDRFSASEYYSLPSVDEVVSAVKAPEGSDKVSVQLWYYDMLLSMGFRRSGNIVYINSCPHCKRCIPIRIDTEAFEFTKSQRHLLRLNSDIEIRIVDSPWEMVTDEKVELLQKYQRRHGDDYTFAKAKEACVVWNGTMEKGKLEYSDVKAYEGTFNMEYYLNGILVGCAVLDRSSKSLSSNYFYYDTDPQVMKRSLGTYSILKEIELCKKTGIKYYYLGYWIKDHTKMNYKQNFKPHELLINDNWMVVKG